MTIKLPQYSGKDYLVLGLFVFPFTLVMNSAIFGMEYFSGWVFFLLSTIITVIAFSVDFILCGAVAVLLKKRFPAEEQVGTKLGLMIATFLVLTGLFLLLLFKGYEKIGFFNYSFNQAGFTWAYFGMGIANIFLTFLHEGIDRYEKWKKSLRETDELNRVYRQSQLMGLKSQVNPHFLFNSLNSLSSLIQEDEKKGEKFLDEMSRVYRYMLRNDDEQLVTLDTELKFVASYEHLLKARYGDGLEISIDVTDASRKNLLPPLTMQTIIENAFSQNVLSKSSPLVIHIKANENGIDISNNIQPKLLTGSVDFESGLDNLVNKYHLLNKTAVVIEDLATQRIIHLPSISSGEAVSL